MTDAAAIIQTAAAIKAAREAGNVPQERALAQALARLAHDAVRGSVVARSQDGGRE
jgi:hypothetical protein